MIDYTDIILAIIAAVLGGGNIWQGLQIKQLRRRGNAQAYQLEIDALRSIIDGNVKEIQRLNVNYGELQEKYFALAEEIQELRTQQKRKTTKTKKNESK